MNQRSANAKQKRKLKQALKLFHGKDWQQKIKPQFLKPIPFEWKYVFKYERLLKKYQAQTTDILLKEIHKQIKQTKPQKRFDDAEEIIVNSNLEEELVAKIETSVSYSNEIIATFSFEIKEIAEEMVIKNSQNFNSQLKKTFGFVPDFKEDISDKHINSWVNENTSLIKNINNQTQTRLNSIISNAYRNGARSESIVEEIQKVQNFTKTRAKLIARDQLAKLNGMQAKHEQLSVGIDKYIWKTSRDERVRESHRVRDGSIRKWGEGIEPQQEFQCRCIDAPVLEL